MSENSNNLTPETIPADDPKRELVHTIKGAGKNVRYVAVVGDVYTILVSGKDTNGQYCLIDMRIPPDGGPPPHRHDFEEMFSVSEGEIELHFRGEKIVVRAGETVNIPANAPHNFTNASGKPARMLCLCSPAGQEEYFLEVGDLVESADSEPPHLSDEEKTARMEKSQKLAAKYKTEFLM